MHKPLINLETVKEPTLDICKQVMISKETIQQRKSKILERMHTKGIDTLIIYADLEHSANFEYLVGFVPRFEEALCVLHINGDVYLVLGNMIDHLTQKLLN